MSAESPARFRCLVLPLLAVVLLTLSGCGISFEHDPAKTVTVEISGIDDATDREAVQETLKGMTDGSSHIMTTSSSGDQMTIKLSPVTDVKAFSQKINFGKVTEVEDRTVKVDFVK